MGSRVVCVQTAPFNVGEIPNTEFSMYLRNRSKRSELVLIMRARSRRPVMSNVGAASMRSVRHREGRKHDVIPGPGYLRSVGPRR